VSPAQFSKQMALLRSMGYRSTTFSAALLQDRKSDVVAITFDDAYSSVLECAAPVLAAYGFVGTVFVPTGFAGRDTPMRWAGIGQWAGSAHEKELRCLSWRDLSALRQAGWEIGSHSRTHPRLTELDDDALLAELAGSRHECEDRLGAPCRAIAYPYGDVDRRVRAASAAAGYATGAGMDSKEHRVLDLHWPRVGVFRNDDALRFRIKVARTTRRTRQYWRPALETRVVRLVRRR
jgi:peptidoglycan/xylan/chitin deacetylase (PgdA/CDA1 family)